MKKCQNPLKITGNWGPLGIQIAIMILCNSAAICRPPDYCSCNFFPCSYICFRKMQLAILDAPLENNCKSVKRGGYIIAIYEPIKMQSCNKDDEKKTIVSIHFHRSTPPKQRLIASLHFERPPSLKGWWCYILLWNIRPGARWALPGTQVVHSPAFQSGDNLKWL